ncbi:hypothetical protein HDR61_03915 [bacterium]|nr:hypothetical protein [bacterium]
MKKNNNVLTKTKNAALYMLMPMMLVACNSREKKISELDEKIDHLETEINRTIHEQERATTDSVKNNLTYMLLTKKISASEQRIDSLRTRNNDLADSIQAKRVNITAKQYPLSTMLSETEINAISAQLQEHHSTWNAAHAKNIIAGRGTLLDLYSVCFDLDYTLFEPSFYILNEDGCIRFDDERDKLCIEFEETKRKQEQEEILATMRKHANQKEFIRNKSEIDKYEHECITCDSVYVEIERYFQEKFKPRLDSLGTQKNILAEQRLALLRESAIMSR